MKNKVQGSVVFLRIFLLLTVLTGSIYPAAVFAQFNRKDSITIANNKSADEFKIRQRGTELLLQFPKTSFRSALKIINNNGSVMKAVMIDEGIESISVSLNGLPKGIYQCVIENRTQRYVKKVLLQ